MNEQVKSQIKRMFPQANLDGALGQANQILQGKTINDAPQILNELGITAEGINGAFERYAGHPAARMILGMVGTSPEKLKSDAMTMLGGSNVSESYTAPPSSKPPSKYPRLK